jgi:hypothetical protein
VGVLVVVLDTPYTPPSGLFGLLLGPARSTSTWPRSGPKKDARFVTSGYGLSDQDPSQRGFEWAGWSFPGGGTVAAGLGRRPKRSRIGRVRLMSRW